MPIENVPQSIRPIYSLGLSNSPIARGQKPVDTTGQRVEAESLSDSIEFVLPWKFLLSRDQAMADGYDLMADFSKWLIEYLHRCGRTVIPTVNFANWNSLPDRRTNRRVSWHSRGQGHGNLHLKIGTFPDHVSLDSAGFSGWSTFSTQPIAPPPHQPADAVRFDNLKKSLVDGRISKYAQPETQVRREFQSNYLFFPMQVRRDIVAKLAWIDTVRLLKILADYAPQSPRMIVVKRHPKCTSRQVGKLIETVKDTPNLHFSNGNIHDLIADSDAVLTVNSGVGAEALLHRKPVIVTGASDYMAAAIHARTENELIAILEKPTIAEPSIDITRFVSDYSSRYMVKLGDEGSLTEHPALQRFLLSERPKALA